MGGNRSLATRLAAVVASGLLDAPAEPAFDRLTRLSAAALRAPTSLLSIVDAERQFFKSACGLEEPWSTRRETPLSHSFCAHVTRTRAPLVVGDARRHEELRHNRAVDELGVVAYLGVPIFFQGEAIGALCVVDSQPREWLDTDTSVLTDFGELVITQLEQQRSRERLVVEAESLVQEIHHRVRNNLQVVTSLVRRQSRRTAEPKLRRVLADLESCVRALALAHATEVRSADFSSVKLDAYLRALARDLRLEASDRIAVRVEHDNEVELELERAVPCGLLVHELVTNAIRHAFPDGRQGTIRVVLSATTSGHLTLIVADDGSGLPPGTSMSASSTRGLGLVAGLAAQLGGELSLTAGPGTTFCISFPREDPEASSRGARAHHDETA